jgi:hypothetical protein
MASPTTSDSTVFNMDMSLKKYSTRPHYLHKPSQFALGLATYIFNIDSVSTYRKAH